MGVRAKANLYLTGTQLDETSHMGVDDESADAADEKPVAKAPPRAPKRAPPIGPPGAGPRGAAMMPPGQTGHRRRSAAPTTPPEEEDPEDTQTAVADLKEKFAEEEADSAFEESDPMGHMVHQAAKQVETSAAAEGSEVERLQAEVEQLRAGLAGATAYIGDIEQQPMPPIVGDGFVIPDHVVADFVRTGRLIHRDGLIHGVSGALSMLALDQPNLVHMTTETATLGQMDELSITSGRLGEDEPIGAGAAWRIHSVLLAVAALNYDGRAACMHVQSPYATALSLKDDLFVLRPPDVGGQALFDKVVIVDYDDENIDDYLRQLSEGLKQSGSTVVISRGNGVYAVGATFDEAWNNAAALEHSMQVLYLARDAGIDI